jgi:prepilin-type N-terminal cleavage/methylation domain-containing protein
MVNNTGRPSAGEGSRLRKCCGAQGFTLVEFLIATTVATVVLSGAVALSMQLQDAYSTQLDDVAVEQDVRFALDAVTRMLRSAGSNSYDVETTDCPSAGTTFLPIRIDPNANSENDDIRIQADLTGPAGAGSPDGFVGGDTGSCDEEGEDITIALDSDTHTITVQDNNTDESPRAITAPVISNLTFTYLNASGTATATAALVSFIKVSVTGRQENYNTGLGDTEVTLEDQVRVRIR